MGPWLVLHGLRPLGFQPGYESMVWGQERALEAPVTVFHAPSGRGKSSLLAFLAGLGDRVEGALTWERPLSWSFLDQGLSCLPGLSVDENLVVGRGPGDVMDQQAGERQAALLDRLGLGAMGRRICGTLSRGELQRLLFARTCLAGSELIFFDEPVAHLDPGWGSVVLEILVEEARAGRRVVISSLDPVQEGLVGHPGLGPDLVRL